MSENVTTTDEAVKGSKVLFTKSVDIVPVRKGIYKNLMQDIAGFNLVVTASETVAKERVHRQRRWGDDPEYDIVMRNFGTTPGEPGTEIEQRIIFGWANVSVEENGEAPVDWHGDVIPTEILETAAYNFVLKHGTANQEHESDTECGFLIESMMFTKEKMNAIGIPDGCVPEGWFVGFYIPDPDVYEKVKDGTYNMFSIEGVAHRVRL